MDISIIVPVFNSQKYLDKCLTSLCTQTFPDVEIIVVDDGSTDSSEEIYTKFSHEYTNIVILKQENQGRVCARRNGIKIASAKYIMFVDSDDWVAKEACIAFMEICKKYDADLVTGGFINESNHTKEIDAFAEGYYSSDEEMNYLRKNALIFDGTDRLGITSPIWGKVYKKSIAEKVMGYIPDELYRGEDVLFNNLYLFHCKSVYINHSALYHYEIHEESTVSRGCPDLLYQVAMVQKVISREIENFPDVFSATQIRMLLNLIRLWNREYDSLLPVRLPYYCFDYSDLPEHGTIVLYGAGQVGKDYYMQIKKTASKRLALWIDKRAPMIRSDKYPVSDLDEIQKTLFDIVLIAVETESIAYQIKYELEEKYNIAANQMFWLKPKHFWI